MDIHTSIVTHSLKASGVCPVFKKNDDLDKENYRPASVLLHMPKLFERIMYTHIEIFMEGYKIYEGYKISDLLTGFRKVHSTQHCLISILEKWKNNRGKVGFVRAIFIDFSKVFCTVNHDLLIAKLGAYGFQKDALSFMKSSLMKSQ